MGSYGTNNSFGRTGRLVLLALAVGTFALSAVGAARNERAGHIAEVGCVTIECAAVNKTAAKTEALGTALEVSSDEHASRPTRVSHHR